MTYWRSNIIFRIVPLAYFSFFLLNNPKQISKELSNLLKETVSFTQTESALLGILLLILALSDVVPYLEGSLPHLKKFYLSRLYIFGALSIALTFLLEKFTNSKLIQYYSYLEVVTNALIVSEINAEEPGKKQEAHEDAPEEDESRPKTE